MKTMLLLFVILLLGIGGCKEDKKSNNSDPGDASTDTVEDVLEDADASVGGNGLEGKEFKIELYAGPFGIRSANEGHVAFPDVTLLQDGRLMLVYREAESHGVDTTGRIVVQYGDLQTGQWTAPETLVDTPGIDDRDPSLTTLSNGDVLLNYFPYQIQSTPHGNLSVHQIYLGRSTDGGSSFDTFNLVPQGVAMEYSEPYLDTDLLWKESGGDPIMVTACSNKTAVDGQKLIVQGYGGYSWNSNNSGAPRSGITLYVSEDHGVSFDEMAVLENANPDTWLQEPALLVLEENHWIMHIRTAEGASPGNQGNMWQTRTTDGGETWSAYEPFEFIGHAPYLIKLSNGVIVSAFRWINSSYTSTNVNFIYSLDEGETWSEMISILEPQTTEVGYPSMVELEDNRLLIIYYVGGYKIEGVLYEFDLVDKE